MEVSFIVEGNRTKPPICRKSLTNFKTLVVYTPPGSEFELTTSVVIGIDCIGRFKSANYHTKKYLEDQSQKKTHRTQVRRGKHRNKVRRRDIGPRSDKEYRDLIA